MPLLKTAREPKAPKPPPDNEKPLPANDGRPGTSGTEVLLVTNTRKASDRFKQAQRAEKTYKAKKRSSIARANFKDAKSHYKESATHLKAAVKLTFAVVRFSPYMLSEKSEVRQLKADEKKRQRTAERKKKLEDALAKEAAKSEEGDETADEEAGSSKAKAKAK